MTMNVPRARESGMLRLGSFTSPAVKVMLFQASAENSDPTWATQNATMRPKNPLAADTAGRNEKSGVIVATSRGAKGEAKFSAMTAAFLPTKRPMTIRSRSDSVLADVKTFWIILPSLRPRVLMKVRRAIIKTPTSCWVDRLRAYPEEMSTGPTIQFVGEIQGTRTPR